MKVCQDCQRCFEDEAAVCSEENHNFLVIGREGNCEIINNYRLSLLVVSTEFCETYHAVNIDSEKPCLIKILAPNLFSENSREMFLGEARDLSVISHPNVARVFASGTLADGSIYLVTELFTGETLKDHLIENGKPSEVTSLKIAEQIAEGLNAIHSLNVFHRNIRPENIILTTDAEDQLLVKIQNLDFGGIRQKIINSNREAHLEDLKYFSPEQFTGRKVDEQTDVYSLGIVLYELIAGHPPFEFADSKSIINKQLKEVPPSVQVNNFEIKALLNHSLTDSLQKRKRLRLRSANIFARRLRYVQQVAKPNLISPAANSHTKKRFQIENHSVYKINDLPEEIFAALPTEELPPIESIIGELLSESETVIFESEENSSCQTTHLIDWEQPDDIPPMPKILEKGAENFISDFAVEPIFIDYEDSVIDSKSNNSTAVAVSQASMPIGFSKNKSFGRNISAKRRILIAAGIGAVVVLAIGGMWINQQLKSSDVERQPVAQTSPSIKAEETKKIEELNPNSVDNDIESAKLPDYKPREIKENNAVSVLHPHNKDKAYRGKSEDCNCNNTVPNNSSPNKNAVPKKVEVIIVGSKSAEENLMLKANEIGIFNRPRIFRKTRF